MANFWEKRPVRTAVKLTVRRVDVNTRGDATATANIGDWVITDVVTGLERIVSNANFHAQFEGADAAGVTYLDDRP